MNVSTPTQWTVSKNSAQAVLPRATKQSTIPYTALGLNTSISQCSISWRFRSYMPHLTGVDRGWVIALVLQGQSQSCMNDFSTGQVCPYPTPTEHWKDELHKSIRKRPNHQNNVAQLTTALMNERNSIPSYWCTRLLSPTYWRVSVSYRGTSRIY